MSPSAPGTPRCTSTWSGCRRFSGSSPASSASAFGLLASNTDGRITYFSLPSAARMAQFPLGRISTWVWSARATPALPSTSAAVIAAINPRRTIDPPRFGSRDAHQNGASLRKSRRGGDTGAAPSTCSVPLAVGEVRPQGRQADQRPLALGIPSRERVRGQPDVPAVYQRGPVDD